MDKKYYCTFSISSKAAVYSRRLVHIITERIYGGFFVQLMVSCIFSLLFTLHVFLSKSVFPHSFFFFVHFLASKSLFPFFVTTIDRISIISGWWTLILLKKLPVEIFKLFLLRGELGSPQVGRHWVKLWRTWSSQLETKGRKKRQATDRRGIKASTILKW